MKLIKNIPIVTMSAVVDDENGLHPAAKRLEGIQEITFNTDFVAVCCVCLYEMFIEHVPENMQVEFEQDFKKTFDVMLDDRASYLRYPDK